MDSTLIVFLALFFTFGVSSAIAFLIYYFKHVRKPLELAKIGKYDDYTELKKILKEKVIVTKIVNAKNRLQINIGSYEERHCC